MKSVSKVLVTGASGFIGSNLTRNLIKTEDEVNVLVRKKSIIKVDTFYDIWITSRFNELLSKYKSFLENCEVEKAAYVLYHFFWDEFCDWYIEIIKISFSKSETDDISNTKSIMNSVLYKFLNLLYPFAPFISIEIRNQLNFHQDTSLHFSDIPKPYEIKNEANNVKHFKILLHLK